MPYKDVERKKRMGAAASTPKTGPPPRVATRRSRTAGGPTRAPRSQHGGPGLLIPIVAGGALAAYEASTAVSAKTEDQTRECSGYGLQKQQAAASVRMRRHQLDFQLGDTSEKEVT